MSEQDEQDYANMLADVEDQYVASHDYKMDYLVWQANDTTATEQHYMASGQYELNLERYADKLHPPEEMDF
jgi:hypothetical protein